MHLKKTAALTAVAALALPGAAVAGKPDHAGSKGKGKTTAQDAKSKPKGVGFTVAGKYVDGFALDKSGKQDLGAFSVSITSANSHARKFLGLTTKPSDESPQSKAFTFAAPDSAVVKFVGFEPGDTLGADDRVKVIGKVTRARKGSTAERKLDIRKVTITDASAPAPAPAA